MAKLFVKKKLGLVQEDMGSYGTLIFSPQPYFFSWQTSFARFYPVYTGHEFLNIFLNLTLFKIILLKMFSAFYTLLIKHD